MYISINNKITTISKKWGTVNKGINLSSTLNNDHSDRFLLNTTETFLEFDIGMSISTKYYKYLVISGHNLTNGGKKIINIRYISGAPGININFNISSDNTIFIPIINNNSGNGSLIISGQLNHSIYISQIAFGDCLSVKQQSGFKLSYLTKNHNNTNNNSPIKIIRKNKTKKQLLKIENISNYSQNGEIKELYENASINNVFIYVNDGYNGINNLVEEAMSCYDVNISSHKSSKSPSIMDVNISFTPLIN